MSKDRQASRWGAGRLPRGVQQHGSGFRAWVSRPGGGKDRSRVFPTIEQAARVAAEWRRQLRELPADPATLEDGMTLVREDENTTPATKAHWEDHYRALAQFFGSDTLLLEIDVRRVREFKRARLKGCKPSTVHHDMSLGRRIFNLAATEKLFTGENPFAAAGMPRLVDEKRDVLRPAEIRWIIATMLSSGLPNASRDAAVVAVVAETGIRRTELCRIRVLDLEAGDLEAARVCVPHSKIGGARYRPVSPALAKSLRALASGRERNEALFGLQPTGVSDLFKRWRRRLESAGLEDASRFRCHVLRHSFATEYWRQTRDGEKLKRAGGWKLLATANKYMHIEDEGDREAVLRMHMLPLSGGPGRGADERPQAEGAS